MGQYINPLVKSQGAGVNVSTYRLVSYGLVAAMMACAAWTTVSLITHLLDWQLGYMVVVCFLVALDRLYTYRRFRDWMMMSKEWLTHFGTQLLIVTILARLVVGLSHGWSTFMAELPRWPQDFMANFFTDEFWVVMGMILVTWALSSNFAALLEDIGLEEDPSTQLAPAPGQRKPTARERLISLFFSLGTVLAAFTALSRLDIRSLVYVNGGFVTQDLPPLAGGGAGTLLYFMLGLALLSQTQFMTMHVRWDMLQIPVNRALAWRWALYSILFLLFVAAVISLVPTSYSLGPIQALSYLLKLFLYVIELIIQAVLGGFFVIVKFIAALMGLQSPVPDLNPSEIIPPLPPQNTDTDGGPTFPWWEVVKSVLFWGAFLGIILFAAVHYLRQHRDALETLRKIPGWHLLEGLWRWLRGLFSNVRAGVSRVVEFGRARLRARQAAARDLLEHGFLSLRNLDPRQRVAFFYLALVRRGGESGLPRGRAQTPAEYAATLEAAMPDVDQDISALTEAFIEARYTRRTVQPEKASLVKSTWERIRKALRGVKMKDGKSVNR